MRVPLLAGIDVGTTNSKVCLVDARTGAVLAARSAPTPGDASALAALACRGLQECITETGRPPDAVGIASAAETGVGLDRERRPLHPILRWDDPRGAEEAAELERRLGRDLLWRRSGINLGTKTPLTRWLWLQRHEPGILAAMRTWAGAADLVAAALTGSVVTDPTLAARTGAFDLATGGWSDETLSAVGLDPSRLPDPAGEAAADGTAGLVPGTPVVVAGHDHLVASHAAGARRPGQTADSLGTAEAVVTVGTAPPPERFVRSGISWNRTADGRHVCLISGFPGSGRLIEWYARSFTADFAEFEQLAAHVEQVPTGIVVEPYLLGRAAPDPDPSRRLRIHGLTERHDRGALALGMLEGACFHTRWIAEHQAAAAQCDLTGVRVFGGPTRSRTWMSTKAAIMPTGIGVVRVPDLAATGAALLAGVRSGVIEDPPVLPAEDLTGAGTAAAYDRVYRTRFLPSVQHETPESRDTP